MMLAIMPALSWPTDDYNIQEQRYDPNEYREFHNTRPDTGDVPDMEQNVYE